MFTVLLLARPARCERGVRIELLPQAQVPGDVVKLSDVAKITCPEALRTVVQGIEICRSPLPGSTRTLSRDYVALLLSRSGVPADRTALTGPKVTEVRRRCTLIPAEQIIEVGKEALVSAFEPSSPAVTVEVLRPPRPLLVPDGEVSLEVNRSLIRAAAGAQTIVVTAKVDGQARGKADACFNVKLSAKVAMLKSPARQFQPASQADVVWEDRDISRIVGPMTDAAELDGKRFRRTVPVGTILTTDMIEPTPDVTKKSPVTIRICSRSVRLTTTGSASEDGCIGQTIRVRGPFGKDELRATVVSASVVEIRL